MFVLGIDGGGTKTIGVLCDHHGRVYSRAVVGPTNPNSLGYDRVETEIQKLLDSIREQTPDCFAKVTSFFAGMSGGDREEDKRRMSGLFQQYLPKGCQVQVDHDAVNALYSGTLGKPGVVHISGTGSITFGIRAQNIRTRVGGWGFLLGDPGSGYSIGHRAVKAIFDEFDGIGEKTILTSFILNHFHLGHVPGLIPIIYDMKKAREILASLSRFVFLAAEQGDHVAKQILYKAGQEMAMSIRALILKLHQDEPNHETIPVVLAGGVFNKADWFVPVIEEILQFDHLQTKLILPELPPVAGSVIAALQQAGVNITDSFIHSFKQEAS
ncbi:N-acetylglucosamine kinase [Neobacillus thermocopriae]|uniref:N-acetylglucosamine kinase n=1 Tax=Neobacillus thermocopriae TaxID=1215031 RepID=UPI002E1FB966|nr:BadF/BadG/BcrA/BcrD ATPase family protein [Neobacillus thermocopriae]MED3712669.1 BadF/BadG/BcrA/BcrD ATPase family protein [Neobacillus thermocopriae]